MMVRLHSALLLIAALGGCDASDAGIEIVGSRVWRAADKRVAVEVDLEAHERLGDNIGTYCTRVTFAGQTNVVEECRADLEDGDTRTVRVLSEGDLPEGAAITVRVRIAGIDVGRTLLAPRR